MLNTFYQLTVAVKAIEHSGPALGGANSSIELGLPQQWA